MNIYEIYLNYLQQAWFIAPAQKHVLVATKSCKTLNSGSQSIGKQLPVAMLETTTLITGEINKRTQEVCPNNG